MFLTNICKFNRCGKKFQNLHDLIIHIEVTHIISDPIVRKVMEEANLKELPLSYILPYKALNPTEQKKMMPKNVASFEEPQFVTKAVAIVEPQLKTKTAINVEPQSPSSVESLFATKSTSIVDAQMVSKSAANVDLQMLQKTEILPKETEIVEPQLKIEAESVKEQPPESQFEFELFSNCSQMLTVIDMVSINMKDKGLAANKDFTEKTGVDIVTINMKDKSLAANKDVTEKTDVGMVTIKMDDKDQDTNRGVSEKAILRPKKENACNKKAFNRFHCQCGGKFKTIRGLKQHNRITHNGRNGKKSEGASESRDTRKPSMRIFTEGTFFVLKDISNDNMPSKKSSMQLTATSTAVTTPSIITLSDEKGQKKQPVDDQPTISIDPPSNNGGRVDAAGEINSLNAGDETPTNAASSGNKNTIYKEHNYSINPNK